MSPYGFDHGSRRRRLGGLAAGVGVHLGVHDEDLDVLAQSKNEVKPAVADVVRPDSLPAPRT